MNDEILVSVDNISHYYGNNCAVDNISFSVCRGEVLGFLGPNGSGKSTAMQMICGVLPTSAGQIRVVGYDMFESSKRAKKHIGFLPEQPPLYRDLTVDEYLGYAARLRSLGGSRLAEAITYSKQRCGLIDIGSRLIKNLSKGLQQRVGIAQAIIHAPAVVVLDEPTSGLDPNQIVAIRSLIRELGVEHSVILSTHILAEAQSVCDRVLIINQGKLVLNEHIGNLQQQNAEIIPLKIGLHRPPALAVLTEIQGVSNVEQIDAKHFKIYCQPDIEIIEQITRLSIESQWQLYEMVPIQDTLEEAFVQLTRGEDIRES